jgi:hypothetical protein
MIDVSEVLIVPIIRKMSYRPDDGGGEADRAFSTNTEIGDVQSFVRFQVPKAARKKMTRLTPYENTRRKSQNAAIFVSRFLV